MTGFSWYNWTVFAVLLFAHVDIPFVRFDLMYCPSHIFTPFCFFLSFWTCKCACSQLPFCAVQSDYFSSISGELTILRASFIRKYLLSERSILLDQLDLDLLSFWTVPRSKLRKIDWTLFEPVITNRHWIICDHILQRLHTCCIHVFISTSNCFRGSALQGQGGFPNAEQLFQRNHTEKIYRVIDFMLLFSDSCQTTLTWFLVDCSSNSFVLWKQTTDITLQPCFVLKCSADSVVHVLHKHVRQFPSVVHGARFGVTDELPAISLQFSQRDRATQHNAVWRLRHFDVIARNACLLGVHDGSHNSLSGLVQLVQEVRGWNRLR